MATIEISWQETMPHGKGWKARKSCCSTMQENLDIMFFGYDGIHNKDYPKKATSPRLSIVRITDDYDVIFTQMKFCPYCGCKIKIKEV